MAGVTLVSKGPDANNQWGTYFINKGQGDTVAPGQSYTFSAVLRAPHTPGDYTFRWQLRNYYGWGGGQLPGIPTKSFFGDIATISSIHVTQRAETPPSSKQPTSGVLSFSDLEYRGSFLTPGLSGHDDKYCNSGLTLRKVAGQTHLLLMAGTYDSYLYEMSIPPATPIVGGSTAALATASLIRNWGKIEYGTINGETVYPNCGFWFDNDASLLYWNHYGEYFTGGPEVFPQLAATRLNADGTTANVHAWHIPDDATPYKSYWSGVTKLSADFAAAYTGGRDMAVGFGGVFCICSTASRGPSLGAIARPNPAANNMDLLPLVNYPENVSACPRDGNYFSNIGYWITRAPNPWTGAWSAYDVCKSGIFIDLPDKKGYVAFGYLATGRIGYDYGGYNIDGHYEQCWFFYNTADLGAAAQGRKAASSVMPDTYTNVELPRSGETITGSCFDEPTRLLYLYQKFATEQNKPVIHVYYVRPSTPSTFPTWRAASFTGADLANDTISGPDADPDSAGLTNLARYAFALPARGPVAAPVTLGTTAVGSDTFLTLSFPRRAAADDLSYTVETSTDLVTWATIPGQTYQAGTPVSVTAQDSVAMGTAVRRFLRLRLLTTP